MDVDFQLQTKLVRSKGHLFVFVANKSLNERFTPSETRCVFVRNKNYDPSGKLNIKDRLVFINQRYVDLHTRFESYYNGDWQRIQKNNSEIEYRKRMKHNLRLLSARRRTVILPKSIEKVESIYKCDGTKCSKNFVESTLDVTANNITSSNDGTTTAIRCLIECPDSKDTSPNSIATAKEKSKVEHAWDGETKMEAKCSKDGGAIEDSESSESSVVLKTKPFSPFQYVKRDSCYATQSVYKWKRGPPSKEQLDNELDSYMSEVKFKPHTSSNEDNDIDSFVEEYMMETEKSLNPGETFEEV